MAMRDVALFDMDGTITPVKEPITEDMICTLENLGQWADIGIVSGNDLNSMLVQLDGLCDLAFLLPCNGTQLYEWSWKELKYEQKFLGNMRLEMGPSKYRLLVRTLLKLQIEFIDDFPRIPLTGPFISDRTSLLNWCPIGAGASSEERGYFAAQYRAPEVLRRLKVNLLDKLAQWYRITDLAVALGGDTSLDIYPLGWDKTFALRHFKERKVWFMGNMCGPDGNDQELFHRTQELWKSGFWVSGPEETRNNIEWLTQRLAKSKKDKGRS